MGLNDEIGLSLQQPSYDNAGYGMVGWIVKASVTIQIGVAAEWACG